MRTFITTLIVAVATGGRLCARMHAAENPIVPEGAKLELLFTRTAKINGGLTEGPGRGAGRQHLLHRHAVRPRPGHDPAIRPGHEQDDGLHGRQRQGQRADLRRQRRPGGLRRGRLRRAPRLALERQNRQEPDRSPTTTRASGSTRPTTCASTPRDGSTSPIRATWATSRASWSIGPSIASTPTARWSKSRTTSKSPTASPCRPTKRRSTSATTTTAPTRSIPARRRPKIGAMKVYAFPLGRRRPGERAQARRWSISAPRMAATACASTSRETSI